MEFYASDVTKITGVKRLRLHQWIEQGFLRPSIQEASGHGTRNIYSRADLYKIALFKKLVESGLQRKRVAEIINTKFSVGDQENSLGAWLKKEKRDFWFVVGRKESELSVFVHQLAPTPKTYGLGEKVEEYKSRGKAPSKTVYETVKNWFEDGGDDVFIINLSKVMKDIDQKISEVKM